MVSVGSWANSTRPSFLKMEAIESLNQRLIDYFGMDTESERAIWRLSWSDFQYEQRLMRYTKEGLELLYPRVQEVPKYPYIKSRWVLERLVLIPVLDQLELPVEQKSYEPMWIFETNKGEALPPKWEAIKHVVDCVYAAIGKHNMTARYPDPDSGKTTKDLIEEERDRITRIQADLFGNETDTTDSLSLKEGIVVPDKKEG